MKVAILAGGLGSRLSEETEVKPKPMVEIGGRPILWHIMKHYAHYGFDDFVSRSATRASTSSATWSTTPSLHGDLTVDAARRHASQPHGNGGRRRRLDGRPRRHRPGHDDRRPHQAARARTSATSTFMLTWGDGVSDVDLDAAARVPPRARQARDADRGAAAGPLRPPRARRRPGRRSSPRSRRSARAGSTAPSSCSSRRCSTTSTATTRSGSASRSSGSPRDGQLMAYRHDASGSAWTRSATRSCSRSCGTNGAPWKSVELTMRVLVTGHDGYIGTRARAAARKRRATRSSGSTATCSTAARSARRPPTSPALRIDIRDVELEHLAGFDAVIHLAGDLERPARRPQRRTTTYDINHHAAGAPGARGEGGGRRALPLLVVVQPLRRGRRRLPRRDAPLQPGHAVRRVEGARRAATSRSSPTTTSARPTCATPPPTASRRGCAATSWSTTSSATPSRPARC